jgi:hypothetical protein
MARLEADIAHLRSDVGDLKEDSVAFVTGWKLSSMP